MLTKQRQARDTITRLIDDLDNIVETEEGPIAIVTSYFKNIFESPNPKKIDEALTNIISAITYTLEKDLTFLDIEGKVKPVLFATHPETFLLPLYICENLSSFIAGFW